MNLPVARRNWLAAGALVLIVGLVALPNGLGFSTGITSDLVPDALKGDFAAKGCLACHGDATNYAANPPGQLTFAIKGADGYIGAQYEADKEYTVEVAFTEANAPEKTNHAGFNLRTDEGAFTGVAGVSKASADGKQATHETAGLTTWSINWKAPAEDKVVVFTLFVNDVDGSANPDKGDMVHRYTFALTNKAGATPGAVEEHEVHYGISLQQYWIGLAGLAGMIVIMLGGYLFLKFGNPHNTDAKDR